MEAKAYFRQDEWNDICKRGIINPGNLLPFQKVIKKALQGERIGIGFIGGSITAGSLSSSPDLCYAYLVYKWFKEKLPMARIEYINAGIGATTSRLGVARVREDLLLHNPDVVFVEFSVNDSNEEEFIETYESLIRRIILHTSDPAVILINSVNYDSGINAQDIHNRVGEYYSLPIVSMRESIYVEIEQGRLNAEMITPDNLHPNDLGHRMVADIINSLLDTIYNNLLNNFHLDTNYRIPEQPITQNRYMESLLWNNKNMNPTLKGFRVDRAIKEGLWDVFKNGWYGSSKGSKISFNVECKSLAILYRKYARKESDGNESFAPIARLVVDNNEEEARALDAHFDEDWGDCLYLHELITGDILSRHSIDISIIDEAEGRDFYIASIITA